MKYLSKIGNWHHVKYGMYSPVEQNIWHEKCVNHDLPSAGCTQCLQAKVAQLEREKEFLRGRLSRVRTAWWNQRCFG